MRSPEITQRHYKSAQLFFHFDDVDLEGGTRSPLHVVKTYAPSARDLTSSSEKPIHLKGRDHALEHQARELLRSLGAPKLAREVRVEWNPRLKTCAGRADYCERLISLNPLLLGPASNQIESSKLEGNKHSNSASESSSHGGAGTLDCLKQSSLTSAAQTQARLGADTLDRWHRSSLTS